MIQNVTCIPAQDDYSTLLKLIPPASLSPACTAREIDEFFSVHPLTFSGSGMMTLDEAKNTDAIRFANSYTCLGAVLSLENNLTRPDFLRLLGEEWTGCDNISSYRRDLKRILGKRGPLREMMTEEENAAYDKLPYNSRYKPRKDDLYCNMVKIYRGCGSSKASREGCSWTLDKDIAHSFPFLNRYRAARPRVVTAMVGKERILAIKLDRGESEIITFSAIPQRVERAVNPFNTGNGGGLVPIEALIASCAAQQGLIGPFEVKA